MVTEPKIRVRRERPGGYTSSFRVAGHKFASCAWWRQVGTYTTREAAIAAARYAAARDGE